MIGLGKWYFRRQFMDNFLRPTDQSRHIRFWLSGCALYRGLTKADVANVLHGRWCTCPRSWCASNLEVRVLPPTIRSMVEGQRCRRSKLKREISINVDAEAIILPSLRFELEAQAVVRLRDSGIRR